VSSEEPTVSRRVLDVATAVGLVAGVLLVFRGPLRAMVESWSVNPMYSHAYTVPFISLGLLWARRNGFKERTPRPARLAAIPIIAAALLAVVLGEVAAIQVLEQLAFVLIIAGIVLFLFGYEYLKVSAPAIAYLLFMVPFWDAFTEPLHASFQQRSAQIGVAIMQAVGVPAYREGTVIALPDLVIEVARACSGVNYLIAVLALALPLAFIRLRSTWRRLVLIGGAMTISALANGLRVALIGVLAYLDIGSPLHGPFHVLHGLFVAGVGYVVLFVGLHYLEKREAAGREETPAATVGTTGPRVWRIADACGLAVVFWTLVFVGLSPTSVPVALAKPLNDLPPQLGAWEAQSSFGVAPEPIDAWLEADQQLHRVYRRSGGDAADLGIWYYSSQQQRRELINFRAAELHRNSKPRTIALPDNHAMTVNVITWPDRHQVGLFWYELGGSPAADETVAKLHSVWSVLTSGRSNAAAIMLRARADDDRRDAAVAALETLATEVHLGLARHWPTAARTSSD
jgi:EpsI family protein